MYWTCEIFGTFRRSRNDSAPGEMCPTLLRPWVVKQDLLKPSATTRNNRISVCM